VVSTSTRNQLIYDEAKARPKTLIVAGIKQEFNIAAKH